MRGSPSFFLTFASLLSYTPLMFIPSFSRIAFNISTILSLNRSIPSASDCTTSTSENLSITSPGKKSASPNTTRQLDVSTVFLRYSHAFSSLSLKNASSISCSVFLVISLTLILEFLFINPFPIG